ncbi:DNA-binding domain-containing protein [Pseudooceanicola aestuarii]|uniref:HvfC/BufC N-terminal domain-containing protein n=1 Tax=Pseudooceanicola aestuarii TaxID=2697319 RepID=UPI0013D0C47A|nr:DNA-binding domain-containing protein [Pseudooceanicola aestuarii]
MTSPQAAFRTAVLNPQAPVPEGLTDGQGGSAGRRFAVYRNNVAVSLTDALLEGFPALTALLGRDNMRTLAGRFLRDCPPTTPLMSRYGTDLPEYLRDFAPLAHVGSLPDLARLELALRQSYHAADHSPADPDRLGALDGADLARARLRLAPSLRLIRSDWPVHDIRLHALDPAHPAPARQAQDIVVLRPAYDPQPRLLPPGGGAFLAAVLDGVPLATALETAMAEAPDFDLTALLSLLLGAGALTDVEITP